MKLTRAFQKELDGELHERLRRQRLPNAYLSLLRELGTDKAVHRLLSGKSSDFHVGLRTIIRAHHRPSLLVQDNRFERAVSDTWSEILETNRPSIHGVLPAVGRIELDHHPLLAWAGTGALVGEDVIATNRHVAKEFVERHGNGFTWMSFEGTAVGSRIDFRAEYDRPEVADFKIVDMLHLEDESGPDIALLRIETNGGGPAPLRLSTAAAEKDDFVAAIGYPWQESRVAPEVEEAMARIFRGVYDVKRLAPGRVTRADGHKVEHDCSTLPGSSGSAVIDLETGAAIALHYSGGVYANFAVAATVIEERLQRLA